MQNPLHPDAAYTLLSTEAIQARVQEMGGEIARDYEGLRPILVGILKGAVVFFADLVRAVPIDLQVDFMATSSYGNRTATSGEVRILKDLDVSIEGRHVLLVEDIVDSGNTLAYLVEALSTRRPASIKVAALLDKPSRRLVPFEPDYRGFTIDDHFVVGYGLDFREIYRNLPGIAVLKPQAYSS